MVYKRETLFSRVFDFLKFVRCTSGGVLGHFVRFCTSGGGGTSRRCFVRVRTLWTVPKEPFINSVRVRRGGGWSATFGRKDLSLVKRARGDRR